MLKLFMDGLGIVYHFYVELNFRLPSMDLLMKLDVLSFARTFVHLKLSIMLIINKYLISKKIVGLKNRRFKK